MNIFHSPARYRTFLLTLWEERGQDSDSAGVWRFRLEDPRTGQKCGFTSLEALFIALEEAIADTGSEPFKTS